MGNPYLHLGVSDGLYETRRNDPEFQLPNGELDVCKTLHHAVESARLVLENNAGRLEPLAMALMDEMQQGRALLTERRFVAYWDLMDSSAMKLDELSLGFSFFPQMLSSFQQQQQILATQYRVGIADIQLRPALTEILYAVGLLVIEYDDVLALGSTDFEFASIYQQRRTNALPETGFRDLAAVARTASQRIEHAVRSIPSSFGLVQRLENARAQPQQRWEWDNNGSAHGSVHRRNELIRALRS